MLPIQPGGGDRYDSLFRARRRSFVRAARRSGISVEEQGPEGLRAFLKVFEDTYAKHGVAATHTPADIEDLLTRLPQHVRLFLAVQEGVPVAGVLVFMLSPRVAYTFYICSSADHPKAQGNIVVFAALLDWLGERGFSWLDLGPAASSRKFNDGVMFFKENLGAIGYTRDRWTWRT
jgi:lipid II:glycine glycyltransferase (peptidoglycan interpeptide bridge formation enzyme)